MRTLKLLFVLALLGLWSNNAIGQDKKPLDEPYEKIFTDKDKDFIQLWYYEQILKMDLDDEGRDDYRTLLTYYTYRMGKLVLPKYGYSNEEQKEKFDELEVKLHAEAKELLSEENYKIHYDSFKVIRDQVYEKKGWVE